jgi:hypothetical protein
LLAQHRPLSSRRTGDKNVHACMRACVWTSDEWLQQSCQCASVHARVHRATAVDERCACARACVWTSIRYQCSVLSLRVD